LGDSVDGRGAFSWNLTRMTTFDLLRKPPALLCPQRYCFFWSAPGERAADGLYANLDEALERSEPITQSGCRCALGLCLRADTTNGEGDYYEPHEPRLAEDSLPWFYFITTPMKLIDDLKEVYIRDSEQLWGARHWET
jgi:hypothetical protein